MDSVGSVPTKMRLSCALVYKGNALSVSSGTSLQEQRPEHLPGIGVHISCEWRRRIGALAQLTTKRAVGLFSERFCFLPTLTLVPIHVSEQFSFFLH